jgi:membrane associated rhomboid family serine protease
MSYQQFRPTSQNRMPRGVLNLIIINFILFVTMNLANSHDPNYDITGRSSFENTLGLHHPFSPDFHFFQYVTSLFMHANFSHILFNMIGLWMFGHLLENAYGTKRFLIFYIVSGIGASLIYQIWISIIQYQHYGAGLGFIETMQLAPPGGLLVGASGAVYGIMMGAALLFPNTEMYFLGFMGIPIKLKWIAVIYGGLELMNAYRQAPGDNVAHFAHIGGMIFGFILVRIYSRDKTRFY